MHIWWVTRSRNGRFRYVRMRWLTSRTRERDTEMFSLLREPQESEHVCVRVCVGSCRPHTHGRMCGVRWCASHSQLVRFARWCRSASGLFYVCVVCVVSYIRCRVAVAVPPAIECRQFVPSRVACTPRVVPTFRQRSSVRSTNAPSSEPAQQTGIDDNNVRTIRMLCNRRDFRLVLVSAMCESNGAVDL